MNDTSSSSAALAQELWAVLRNAIPDLDVGECSARWETELGVARADWVDGTVANLRGRRWTSLCTIETNLGRGRLTQRPERLPYANQHAALGVFLPDVTGAGARCASRASFLSGSTVDDDAALQIHLLGLAATSHVAQARAAETAEKSDRSRTESVVPDAGSACTPDQLKSVRELLGSAAELSDTRVEGSVPFQPRDGVAISSPFATLSIDAAAVHPTLGMGLRATLALPVNLRHMPTARIASKLNLHDVGNAQGPPMFGGWAPCNDSEALEFVTFVPDLGYREGLAVALASWAAERAAWAAAWFQPTTSTRR